MKIKTKGINCQLIAGKDAEQQEFSFIVGENAKA